MLGRHSFRPYPEMGIASRERKRAVSAQHTPRQNHLLAALPGEDYERLLPHLAPVPLPLGCTVHCAGDRERYITVVDRSQLEAQVCECYAVVKREYDRLLPDKSAPS
jgi:hypothetical protein